MKKVLMILLSMMLIFSAVGCGPGIKPEEPKKPEEPVKQEEPVQDEIPKEPETTVSTVKLYLPDDNFMEMQPVEVQIESSSTKDLTQKIWDELIAHELFTEECKMNSLEEVEDGKLELDVNKAFGDYLRGMGTTGEYFIIGGVVNSMLDALGCSSMKITEDGGQLATGHVIYDGYLGVYE